MAACALLATAAPALAEDAGLRWTYEHLLVAADRGTGLDNVISHIENDPALHDQRMLDVVGEVVAVDAKHAPFSQLHLQWLAQILDKSGGARYALVFTELARVTGPSGSTLFMGQRKREREELNRMAMKLHKKYLKRRADHYVPGTIDLAAMRREYEAAMLAAHHTTDQARQLLALRFHATFDEVFAIAGKPEMMSLGNDPYTWRDQFTWRGTQIVALDELYLYYRGLGRVRFTWEQTGGWHFSQFIADPLRFEREFPYRAEPAAHGQPDENTLLMLELLSEAFPNVQRAAELGLKHSELPLEFSDTAAEILARGYADSTTSESDAAYIAICRMLMRHNVFRYGKLLATVSEKSGDSTLRQAIGIVHVMDDADSYVPGTISLDAQRRKYPPLYPDSTLYGSR
jgi:hypothetical protein